MSIAVVNHRVVERNPDLIGFPDSVPVVINERAGINVRLPLLDADIAKVQGFSWGYVSRRRETVNDLIVPLIAS